MNPIFFILFVAFPLAELVVFIIFCESFGFFHSVLLLFLSAFVGIALIRAEGVRTLLTLNRALETGRVPEERGFDAFCIALAGVLLAVPGFISDFFGILLLLPPVRRRIHGHFTPAATKAADQAVLEGEFERTDE